MSVDANISNLFRLVSLVSLVPPPSPFLFRGYLIIFIVSNIREGGSVIVIVVAVVAVVVVVVNFVVNFVVSDSVSVFVVVYSFVVAALRSHMMCKWRHTFGGFLTLANSRNMVF